jgi:hypothetical protein
MYKLYTFGIFVIVSAMNSVWLTLGEFGPWDLINSKIMY